MTIASMCQRGCSAWAMARTLQRAPSTVTRELERNTLAGMPYASHFAQQACQARLRAARWSKSGVPDRVFEALQQAQILRVRIEVVSLDATIVKVHPDGAGALKNQGPRPSESPEEDGSPRFIWLPRMLERL